MWVDKYSFLLNAILYKIAFKTLTLLMKMQVFLLAMEIAATSESCSTDSTNMFCVFCMADDLPLQEPSCAIVFAKGCN